MHIEFLYMGYCVSWWTTSRTIAGARNRISTDDQERAFVTIADADKKGIFDEWKLFFIRAIVLPIRTYAIIWQAQEPFISRHFRGKEMFLRQRKKATYWK